MPLSSHAAEPTGATLVAGRTRGRLAKPAKATRRLKVSYAVAVAVFHVVALLAFVPALFSWTGVALVFLGNYVFCSIGIGLCYHRALTHRSLVLPKWLEHAFAILGVCALQDTPLQWVTTHRRHHQHSDQQEDPHSPRAGFFWSHMGWMLRENDSINTVEAYLKYTPDLLKDRFYKRLERRYRWLALYVAHALLFFAVGLVGDWIATGSFAAGVRFGASLFVWGVAVRTVYSWHVTFAVNSAAHRFGYRSHETPDGSRNNWLVALATNGEGWHNNHHAHQSSAAHGLRWWELDVTYLTICALKLVGLATNVRGVDKRAR